MQGHGQTFGRSSAFRRTGIAAIKNLDNGYFGVYMIGTTAEGSGGTHLSLRWSCQDFPFWVDLVDKVGALFGMTSLSAELITLSGLFPLFPIPSSPLPSPHCCRTCCLRIRFLLSSPMQAVCRAADICVQNPASYLLYKLREGGEYSLQLFPSLVCYQVPQSLPEHNR